ncbi:MAG: hypothetical protein FJY85_09815 [Deltaproteobacteria bacterium]|nr:hypothetical protein [Deltaproteobacteria bacterium]
MKKLLAKGLLVIIEAGIEVLTERIKKGGKPNGNSDGLSRGHCGGPADDLGVQPGGSSHPNHLGRRVNSA